MMKNRFIQFGIFFFIINTSYAQQNLNELLPIDKNVKIGKLPNGLTYYIRKNTKPEKKVELRLVVNAGSILEDNEQQGLAHFCEHMAFNGSKHFKKNELVSFLQSIGIEFGADLNAYTSFDETVYILPIPTTKSGNLEKGFQILEDWAHNCTYENTEIDKERGVILEESRLNKGADERIQNQLFPYLFENSLYANRIPIGKDSILKIFPHERIKQFYKDWYRPNLMAVIVVGDIDVNQIENLIKKHFTDFKNPAQPKARKIEKIAERTTTKVITIKDRESPSTFLGIFYPFKSITPEKKIGDYKTYIIKHLFLTMMNNRLDEIRQEENAPFSFASTSLNESIRSYQGLTLIGVPINDNIDKVLFSLIEEIEKVKKQGFTLSELEEAKKILASGYEKSYKERDKRESNTYAEEYIRNFLEDEMIPGIENEFQYFNDLNPSITIQDINSFILTITKNNNPLIAIIGPDKKEIAYPTEEHILSIVKQASSKEITIASEKKITEKLVKQKPIPGTTIEEKQNSVLQTTELKLSNGVTVTIKKTDFKDDEIRLLATRKGGASLTSTEDIYYVKYLNSIIGEMGIGDFTPTDLRKMNAGKIASVSFSLGETTESITGSSSVKDQETLFQLLYLYITQPRKDEKLFSVFKQQEISGLTHLKDDPQTAFLDTLINVLYQNSPLAPITIPNAEKIKKINLDHLIQIYKQHFGDITDYHFTIVGNINLDTLKPLLETYIASLPTVSRITTWKDRGLRIINGQKKLTYKKGIEKKSLILELFHGPIEYTPDLALKAKAVEEIINIKMTEELREKMSGVYTSGVSIQVRKEPFQSFIAQAYLPCGPEKVDTLIYAFDQIIKNIKQKGPTKKDLNKVKELWKEHRKTSLKENGYWLSALNNIYTGDLPIDRFMKYEKIVNALTIKDIQQTANLLFDEKNKFIGILLPE